MVKLAQRFHDSKSESTEARHVRFRKKFGSSQAIGGRQNPNTMTTVISAEARNFRKHAWKYLCPYVIPSELLTYWRLCPHGSIENVCAMTTPDWDTYRGLLTEVGQPFYPPNIENYAGMVTFIALHGNFGIGDRTGADAVPEASTRTQVTSSARIALQDKIKRRHECMRIMDSLKSFTDFSHIASTIEEVQTLIHARENRDDDVNVDVLTYLVKSVLNGMFSGTLHRVIACGIAFYELLSNSVTNQIALEHVNDLMQQTLKEGISATFEGLKSTSVLFCWCFVVSVLLAFHRSDDAGKQEREKKKASMKECKLPLSVKTLCIHILCLAHKKSAHSRVWAVELICKTLTTTPSVEMITEVLPIIQRTYIPAVDDESCMTAEAIRLGVFLKDILTRFTPFEGFPTKKSHNCQSEISSLGSFQQIVQKKFADTLCNRFTTTVLKALSTSTPPVWAAHPSIHPLFRTLTDEWRRELQKRDSSDAAVLIRILITSFVNKLPKETVPQRTTAAQLYHDFVQLVAHTVRGRVCNQLLFEIQETFDTGPLPCIQPASLFEMEQILVKTQLFAVCDGLIESFDDAVAPNYNIATSDNGGMEIDSESDESDEETNTNTGILSTNSNNHFVQTVRLFVIRQLEILCKVRVAKDCKNELDEVVTRVTHFYIMNGFFRVPEGCEHKGSQLTHVDAVQRQMCRTNAHILVHNIRWSDQDKKSQSYRSDQKRHGSLQYGWGPLLQKCHSLMETGDAEPVFSNAIGFVQSDSNDSEGSFSYVNNFLGFLCIDEGPNTELDWDVHCCLTHFVLYMWCEDGYITDDFKYQTVLKLMEAVAEVKLSKSKDKNSNIKPEKEAQNESLAKERITKDFEKGQDLCVRSLLPLMIQLCCASSNTMHGRIPLRFMERAIERMLMSFPEQLLPIVVHGLTAGSFNKKVSKKNQINIENAQNSFEEYSLPVHTKCVRHPMPGEAVQLRLLSILASRFSTSWHFYMALAPSLEIVHDMWNRRFSTLLPVMEDKEVESSCKGLLTALVAWSGHRSVPVSNEKIAQKYCSVILELVDCATRLLTVIRCHRKEGRLSEPKWFKESILRIVSNCVAHAEEHEERVRAVLTAVGNIFINLLVPKKNALNEPENKKAAKLGSACTITPELLQMVLSIVPETFWVQHVLATAQFMKVYTDASQASTRYTLSVRCAHIGVMLRFYTQRRRLAVRSKHEAKDCFGDMSFGKWFADFLHKWSPWKQLSQLSVTTSAPVDQGDSLLGETSTAEMNRKIAFLMDALLPTLVPLLTCPVWKDCASVAETMSDCLTYLRQRMSFMTSRTKSYIAQLAVHSAAPLTTTELENIAIVPRSQLFSVAHQRECAQKRSRNPRPGGRQDSPMEQNPVDTLSETEPTPGNPIPDHSEERKQKRKRRKNGDVTTASRTRLNKSDHMKSSEEQKREKLIRRQTILERKREKRKRRKQA